MSYHGPRDNGEGRPKDLPQAVTSHIPSMADSTNPEDTSPPTESTMEHTTVSSDSALPTPQHLRPMLKLLRGHKSRSTADDRSRSPSLRDLSTSSANATSRRLYFYQGSAASLLVIENLSARMEQSVKDSLQVLSLNQVRSHIQHILAEHQPFDAEPSVPLSTRLTTAVNNIRDPIQDI